jgi:iron complex transport system substrate-binding protein
VLLAAFLCVLGCVLGGAGACGRSDHRPTQSGKHRIVCLSPSSTEVVAALGATDEIVGVDQYSLYPLAVQHLPKVGDYISPNLEAILALHPDIAVLDAVQSQAQGRLQAAGITTVSMKMLTIDDVRIGLHQVARTLGRETQANALVAQLDAELSRLRDEAAKKRGASGHAVRVLVVVDRQPGGLGGIYAAGPHTFLDEVVTLLGGENVLASAPVSYANLAADHVIALAPDVILETTPATDAAKARADWNVLASVPAVAHGRIYQVADPTLQAPGPRLTQGIARLLPLLWP